MPRPTLQGILDQGIFFAQGSAKGEAAAMAFAGGPATERKHSAKKRARRAYMDGVLAGVSLALAAPPSGPTEGHQQIIYEGVRTALSLGLEPNNPDNVFPGGTIKGVSISNTVYVIQAEMRNMEQSSSSTQLPKTQNVNIPIQ